MAEQDALSDAKLGSNLFLKYFPVKIRVLTRDPMVYNDKYANTKYAFIVYNIDDDCVQIIDKTSGFADAFKRINSDPDYGSDVRGIDIKITTNGKAGIEVRYDIKTVGDPKPLTQEQLKTIKEAAVDLEAVIKKKAPGALRLSEVNKGGKPGSATDDEDQPVEPSKTTKAEDVVIEDIGDEPINLDDIPF